MHADTMEDLSEAGCGEIAALFGIDCASGDTFCDPKLNYSMSSMYVPKPVISLAVHPVDKKASDNMAKALNRFTKEDPTFRTFVDPESNQTIIQGMGELHLEVYVERMKREYKAVVEVGQPEVAYREAITQRADFVYTHKKQTGGSGQYAKVAGYIEPLIATGVDEEDADYEFVDEIKGGTIPTEFIPSCDKGFQLAMKKGTQVGFRSSESGGDQRRSVPCGGLSDQAFQTAALGRSARHRECEAGDSGADHESGSGCPQRVPGSVFACKPEAGVIISSNEDNQVSTILGEVPSEMFDIRRFFGRDPGKR